MFSLVIKVRVLCIVSLFCERHISVPYVPRFFMNLHYHSYWYGPLGLRYNSYIFLFHCCFVNLIPNMSYISVLLCDRCFFQFGHVGLMCYVTYFSTGLMYDVNVGL